MIELTGIQKRFTGGAADVWALRGVDLAIGGGEFVTFIGTNGSGKSTLLNIIAGTIAPDEGRIALAGQDVTGQDDWQRAGLVARVFQNPFSGTAPGMTIAENLLMAWLRGRPRGIRFSLNRPRREEFRQAVACLEMGLEDRLDQPVGTLSGGQRQAVTLLMAVLRRPAVLLLDEHTAALDPKTAAQIIYLTGEFISRDRLTTIMITHSMQQALDSGDRTIMMHQGRIIDDIPAAGKRRLTTADLLERFEQLRKKERLTPEVLEQLRREYV